MLAVRLASRSFTCTFTCWAGGLSAGHRGNEPPAFVAIRVPPLPRSNSPLASNLYQAMRPAQMWAVGQPQSIQSQTGPA
jgi:spore coat protein U-like protein